MMRSENGPEYRWYVSLCAAYGVNPRDPEWLAWAADEWGNYLSERPAGRFLGFRRSFERRFQKARFQRDARTAALN